jgi:hypothetical protein
MYLYIGFRLICWYFIHHVTDVFSTEMEIRLSFVKTSEFRGREVWTPKTPPPLSTPLSACIPNDSRISIVLDHMDRIYL